MDKNTRNNRRTRLRRLRRLRDVVIPATDMEHLSFSSWKCGTFMCLAGFACDDIGFKRAGLHFHTDYGSPAYAVHLSYAALANFFLISTNEADIMFGLRRLDSNAKELDYRKQQLDRLIKDYGGDVNITYAESV